MTVREEQREREREFEESDVKKANPCDPAATPLGRS